MAVNLINNGIYFVENGVPRRAKDVEAVELFLKKFATKDLWEVLDFLIHVMLNRHPELKETSANRLVNPKNKFASDDEGEFRMVANIPINLWDSIIRLYPYINEDREEKSKFIEAFIKRYPIFRVPEKI